jgi:hypothetical protein
MRLALLLLASCGADAHTAQGWPVVYDEVPPYAMRDVDQVIALTAAQATRALGAPAHRWLADSDLSITYRRPERMTAAGYYHRSWIEIARLGECPAANALTHELTHHIERLDRGDTDPRHQTHYWRTVYEPADAQAHDEICGGALRIDVEPLRDCEVTW